MLEILRRQLQALMRQAWTLSVPESTGAYVIDCLHPWVGWALTQWELSP